MMEGGRRREEGQTRRDGEGEGESFAVQAEAYG
jgi:hypothetical protein